MKSLRAILSTGLVVLALLAPLGAQSAFVPAIIRLEGALTTATGQPRVGTVTLVISLYAGQQEVNALWLEQQPVTLDATGHYTVLVGATLPEGIPRELLTSTTGRWLGIGVLGEAEQPRVAILSAPYAIKALEADTLSGRSVSDFVLAENLGSSVQSVLRTAGVSTLTPPPTSLTTTTNTLAKFTDTVGTLGVTGITETNTGRVGIKTPSPQDSLHVADTSITGVLIDKTVDDPGGAARMVLRTPTSRFGFATESSQGATLPNGFGIYDYTTAQWRFNVDASGNVGIGTTHPAARLDVQGDIKVLGNINAKYQDVAEWVETSAPLEAGTVVIVDPDRSNQVRAAPGAYDTRVAGAVSRQPGLILGEQSGGKVTVAQSGRVRVKVDASYGAIKIGDLLVTSPRPGYAMVSTPVVIEGVAMHRPGTLLGKALEALPSGQGEILVLLTLQ